MEPAEMDCVRTMADGGDVVPERVCKSVGNAVVSLEELIVFSGCCISIEVLLWLHLLSSCHLSTVIVVSYNLSIEKL